MEVKTNRNNPDGRKKFHTTRHQKECPTKNKNT